MSTTLMPPTWPGNGFAATSTISGTSWQSRSVKATGPRRGSSANAGGCTFAAEPKLDATQTLIVWSPEANTSTIPLVSAPSIFPMDRGSFTLLDCAEIRADELGTFVRYTLPDGDTLHLLRLAGVDSRRPLAAIIPLDPDALDRIEATLRLAQALLGRRVSKDTRLTLQRRRRTRFMLQAVDGRMNGASYREIAAVLFGVSRVADEPWKTSALRDTTLDLVKGAILMIAGGYRALLRHRRRS